MPTSGSLNLFELLENKNLELTLENLNIEHLQTIEIKDNRVQVVGLSIAGFTDHLYKDRIQLFGKSEMDYLKTLEQKDQVKMSDTFLKENPVLVIFTHPERPPQYFKEIADRYNIPLMSTQMISSVFVDYIKGLLNRLLSVYTTLHAQLIDVLSVGMLIMGESGVGKSETSLDLVMKGHKLIADDVVEIKHIPPDHLIGSSNEMMRSLIEIRGIGLVDLQQMFGVTSVAYEKEIDCIVRLALWDEKHHFEYERVGSTINYYEILGVKKPYYIIPVRHGSNLSSIMEATARDYLLKKMGINAAEQFEKKLSEKLKKLGG
ncbi:MAG TPA: HPr(Ser) kinase/phosphatase [bacterium]|nr:HPr(Ser) kinase/phosphatase [bacterium]HPS29249.1 HPr(Ser) kinase/phosphatase [bacterium]